MRVSGKAAVTIIVKALPIQTTKFIRQTRYWGQLYETVAGEDITLLLSGLVDSVLYVYVGIYIHIYLYTIYISLYIFNAFISGHVGTPEIAGRYLAVFQVLISSRTGYHPPSAGGGCTLCRLEASTPVPTPSLLPSPPATGVARDAPIRLHLHPLLSAKLQFQLPSTHRASIPCDLATSHRRRIFRYRRRLRSDLRVTLQ